MDFQIYITQTSYYGWDVILENPIVTGDKNNPTPVPHMNQRNRIGSMNNMEMDSLGERVFRFKADTAQLDFLDALKTMERVKFLTASAVFSALTEEVEKILKENPNLNS